LYAPEEYERLRETDEAAKIGFILAELDLALTFCEIAESAADDATASQNEARARKRMTAQLAFSQALH